MLDVGFKSGVHVFNLLVDQAHFQENASDLRMVISDTWLQNIKSSMQVFEPFREVAAVVIVHG